MQARSIGKLVIGGMILSAFAYGCKEKIMQNGQSMRKSQAALLSNYNLNDSLYNQVAIGVHRGDYTYQQADSFMKAKKAGVEELNKTFDFKAAQKAVSQLRKLVLHK